jgi:hypothetical protein
VAVELNYKAFRRSLRNFSQSFGSALIGFLQGGTGAVQRTVQEKLRDTISILDFIPQSEHAAILAGTSTYDCYTAITNAMASVIAWPAQANQNAGPEINFPPGGYNCNQTLHIKRQVHLRGANGGLADGQPSRIIFPADVAGIVIHTYNTDETGVASPTRSAGGDGSIIECLTIQGTGGAASAASYNVDAPGIWLRARAHLKNVTVRNFKGRGVQIIATSTGGGFSEGNANNWHAEYLRIVTSNGDAFFVDGGDSNSGVAIGLDCSINAGWGVYDSSFLGNTYVGCHTDACAAGAYKTDSTSGRNLLLNCYAEGGQPASSLVYPTKAVGGLYFASPTGDFIDEILYTTQVRGAGKFGANAIAYNYMGQVDYADGNLHQLWSDDSAQYFRLKYITGLFKWDWANNTSLIDGYYTEDATIANGFARDLSAGSKAINKYYKGDSSQMKLRALLAGSSGVPGAGTHIVGDCYEYTAPIAGGYKGVVCVTAGTPGTFEPYGPINLSGSATYDPGSLADGAGVTTTVTATGAALGDFALASFSLDLQGISVTAWVSAANTVSVRFQNESGGVLDLASGTLRVRVIKQ